MRAVNSVARQPTATVRHCPGLEKSSLSKMRARKLASQFEHRSVSLDPAVSCLHGLDDAAGESLGTEFLSQVGENLFKRG